ncbi:hypothetical protein J6590_054954 [Homalodisca vitripennis]|nr:hypothetical protein J6590_054954 [Homalodisca vitripennis]
MLQQSWKKSTPLETRLLRRGSLAIESWKSLQWIDSLGSMSKQLPNVNPVDVLCGLRRLDMGGILTLVAPHQLAVPDTQHRGIVESFSGSSDKAQNLVGYITYRVHLLTKYKLLLKTTPWSRTELKPASACTRVGDGGI